MSSFNRRLFLLGSAAALGGCGFAPVYAPSGGGTRLLNTVMVDAPKTRPAFLLTRQIEDRLGRAGNARYGLGYKITLQNAAIAIDANDVTTRYNLLGAVTYVLRDMSTDAVLSTGKVDSFTSYSASGSTVATQAAEADAQERLMVILADRIVTRLMAAAPGLPE